MNEDREKRREEICDLLARAYADDRIELDDYEHLLDLVNSADSMDQLETVIHDLPVRSVGYESPGAEAPAAPAVAETKVAIIGDQHIDHRSFESGPVRSISLIGDVEVDLRKITPGSGPVVLSVFSLIGDTTVIVPRGMRVRNQVVKLLGDAEYRESEEPDGPERPGFRGSCTITGFSLLGDIVVQEEGYRKKGLLRSLWRR